MMNCGNCQSGFPEMPQVQPVVCPPEYIFRDEFMPREVPVVHPIVHVNRQHFVDVPRHFYTETTENVMGAPMMPGGGFGPQYGGGMDPGFGPDFCAGGCSPWMSR